MELLVVEDASLLMEDHSVEVLLDLMELEGRRVSLAARLVLMEVELLVVEDASLLMEDDAVEVLLNFMELERRQVSMEG